MRFRHRMKVDFPQPDGPMIAVTALGAIVRSMPFSTCALPNHALTPVTWMPSTIPSPHSTEPAPCDHAGRQAHDEYDTNEHERAGPGLTMPVVVGGDRVREDLQRQCRDRLIEPLVPEPVAERREQQRRRLAGHARHGHHDASDDSGPRRRQHDAQYDL